MITVTVEADGKRVITDPAHPWLGEVVIPRVVTAAEWEQLRQAKPERWRSRRPDWKDESLGINMVTVHLKQDDGRPRTFQMVEEQWAELQRYF